MGIRGNYGYYFHGSHNYLHPCRRICTDSGGMIRSMKCMEKARPIPRAWLEEHQCSQSLLLANMDTVHDRNADC